MVRHSGPRAVGGPERRGAAAALSGVLLLVVPVPFPGRAPERRLGRAQLPPTGGGPVAAAVPVSAATRRR